MNRVIAEQQQVFDALRSGDEKKFGFLVGQILKGSEGKANPQEVNRLLKERLAKEQGE